MIERAGLAPRRIAGADPRNIAATKRQLRGILPAAFDIGLHDLLGKILDVPVCSLLGGKLRDRIPFCYPIFDIHGEEDIEVNIQRVQRVYDMGFRRIRKYIGRHLDAEEKFLQKLRDTFGWELEIKSLDLSRRFYWQESLALLERWWR